MEKKKTIRRKGRKTELSTWAITVAVMGCAVNGPGEVASADVGIAGGIGEAVLFRRGEILEKIPEDQIIQRLIAEVRKLKDGGTHE